jgi:glycosyltransferase involved in cell wall biosynthesis
MTSSVVPVAILLCVHRGADPAQLDDALASMRAQTHGDVRLYVYADGPLDPPHEAALARHLCTAPSRDRLLRGEKSLGLPTGLNTLIEAALDDPAILFLARMDADDLSTPERIERQLFFMQQHPEVSIAGTWCIEFHQPGVPVFHKKMPGTRDEVVRAMLFRNALAHPTVMFRRAVFERGHRYDTNYRLMQDYELWSRLIVAGESISNVPEYLLWFRVGDDFYNRRAGFKRAWKEVGLRLRYARRAHLFRPAQVFGLGALFLMRVMPGSIMRLAYKHLR